jgi:hypothetical protein
LLGLEVPTQLLARADGNLPGGLVCWFDGRPQRSMRPDRAKQMDHTTEHHYAEERQQAH